MQNSYSVLIKSAGNKLNLVKEFQKWGAFVIADDINPNTKACLAADDYYRGQLVDLVIETRDAEIKHPICGDKAEFYRFCRRHGFDTPITGQFKAIVKHRNGSGSRNQFIFDRSYVVQEFIDWPEYSIDYFADNNAVPLSIIPRQRLCIVNGESQEAKITFNPILIKEALRMGKELNIKGPACMQLFFNDKDVKWIEVNPRYGGGSHLTWHIFSGPRYQLEQLKMRDYNVQTAKGSEV